MVSRPRLAAVLVAVILVVLGLLAWPRDPAPVRSVVAVRAVARPPPRRAAPSVTALRLVDESGRPVAGVPVWEGSGAMSFTLEDGLHNDGVLLGESDADGLFVPDQLPIELNVAPWASAPGSVAMADDGREHVLTVAPACELALSWDPPPDPVITDVTLDGAFSTSVAVGRARLTVPCGVLAVATRSASTPSVEPVPAAVDTRSGSAHIEWQEPFSVRICVSDEAGTHLAEAEVGSAWRDGDCWRYAGLGCAHVRAEGFLEAEVCPDLGWLGWVWDDYDVSLERGVPVRIACEGGPCPARMGILACITDATPDRGACGAEQCTCPDAEDARVIASAGPYAGESAWVIDGAATFEHTGSATLVLRGEAAPGAVLSRVERDGDVVVARIPADGVRGGLVAGSYRVMVNLESGTVEVSGIELADGERREVTLGLPSDEIEVEWTGEAPANVVFVVEGPGLRATWFEAPARVVPGATLWACTDAGCCRFEDPAPRVMCEPDAAVLPPLAWR